MSARDRLTELIRTHPDYADMIAPEDLADEILDEHAHELAEKIRYHGGVRVALSEHLRGMAAAADLIDPQMP